MVLRYLIFFFILWDFLGNVYFGDGRVLKGFFKILVCNWYILLFLLIYYWLKKFYVVNVKLRGREVYYS